MSVLVGIILLLVFLAFAALMFLERLSALLALPLMAAAFLAVAAAADLVQPAQVVELEAAGGWAGAEGRRALLEWRPGPSRFARWRAARQRTAVCLNEVAESFAGAVRGVGELVERGGEGWRAGVGGLLRDLRLHDENLRTATLDALAGVQAQFAKPPFHAGPAAGVQARLAEIPLGAFAAAVLAVAEGGADDAAARAELRGLLPRWQREARRVAGAYPPPAAPSARDWLADAAGYLGAYAFLLVRGGSFTLYAAILATIFGGMFAMYVRHLKVAEQLVYWTAEFAGERPLVIGLAVFVVTGVIFTSVGGLGTVIMIGTIVLPILRSVGLSPVVGAGLFLMAIAMGGTLQPVSRRLWMEFYGVSAAELDTILWTFVGLYAACGLAWLAWGTRRGLLSSFHAVAAAVAAERPARSVPARLMVAPLIPVALVYFGGIEEITAFTLAIGYMYLCVCTRPGALRVLARALIEGAQTVMPPCLLMVGIGMLVTALGTASVQAYLRPLLAAAVPETRAGYIALFALAAPLALYRGPLNVWGMGLAVSATLLATTSLAPAAILCAILAAGMLQGVCDPTNTANVWIAGFQGITVNQILRYTLLPVWAAAAAAVVLFGLRFVG